MESVAEELYSLGTAACGWWLQTIKPLRYGNRPLGLHPVPPLL